MKRLVNFVLLLITLGAGAGLSAMMIGRPSILEVSRFSYPVDGPLMGSYFVDVLIRPEAAIIVLLMLAGILFKELVTPLNRRIAINFAAATVFMALGVASVHAVYIQPAAEHQSVGGSPQGPNWADQKNE